MIQFTFDSKCMPLEKIIELALNNPEQVGIWMGGRLYKITCEDITPRNANDIDNPIRFEPVYRAEMPTANGEKLPKPVSVGLCGTGI